MFCFRYRRLLIPYSEGGLAERTAAKVEAHLAGCASCAAELRIIQSVSVTLRQSNDSKIEPAHDLWARVNERIAGEVPAPARSLWKLLPQAATAAAGVILVIVVSTSLWRTAPPTQQARVQELKSASPHEFSAPPVVAAKKFKMPKRHLPRAVMMAKAPEAESPSMAPVPPAAAPSNAEIATKEFKAPQSLYSRDRNEYFGVATQQKDNKADLSQSVSVTDKPSTYLPKAAAPVTVAADSGNPSPNLGLDAKGVPPAAAQTQLSGTCASYRFTDACAESAKATVSETLETAKKLVKEHPEQPENWLKLGEAYEAAGKKDDALAAYNKATEGSDAKIAATAKEKIKVLQAK